MIRLLAKLFIKPQNNASPDRARTAYGVLSGCVGIALNLLLFAAKMTAGFIAKAVSLQADAFNNLGDAGSSVIALFGFRLASKKPDSDHPYGHGRFEYIAGLFVAVAILLMGISLLRDSISTLINGGEPAYLEHFAFSCAVMIGAILVKLYMFAYNRRLSVSLQAPSLRAVATDSLTDAIATCTVLLCALVSHYVALPDWLRLDAICGAAVSAFIIFTGLKTIRETMTPLLGKRPDPAFVKEIESAVLSFEGIYGVHDIIVHDYGPGRVFVSLHAEVSAYADIRETHDVIDNAEKYLSERFSCNATIHMDPIQTDDPLTNSLKAQILDFLKAIDARISLHDFRVIKGPTHTGVVFDAVLPYDLTVSEDELRARIGTYLQGLSAQYQAFVEFDRSDSFDILTQTGDQP